jgi:hypothetical protein
MGGCETRLISDAPAGIDAFRSHAGIALALAELMRRESGGRSIALAGPWGSGKSTIVELLKESLDSKDEAVLVFDAWSHQGDPLRRAFLEEARRFLLRAQWIRQADLREEFESLSHRTNRSRTNVTSILGWGGGVMAVLVFLAALGVAFVSKFTPDQTGFWVGLVLFLSPLAVAFLMLIAFGICQLAARFYPEKVSTDRWQNPLVLLWKRTREVQISSGLQTPDPTSIEFASIFSRLLDQALQRKERRLVIVVDNLDRLDPEEARQAWSTME